MTRKEWRKMKHAKATAEPSVPLSLVGKVRLAAGSLWMMAGCALIIPYEFIRMTDGRSTTDGFGFAVFELPAWLKWYLYYTGMTDWHGAATLAHLAGWLLVMGLGFLMLPRSACVRS